MIYINYYFIFIFFLLNILSNAKNNNTVKVKRVVHTPKFDVYNPFFNFNLTLALQDLFLGILINTGAEKVTYMKQIKQWNGPIGVGINMLNEDIISSTSHCIYCNLKSVNNLNNRLAAYFFYKYSKIKNFQSKVKKFFNNIDCKNKKTLYIACKKSQLKIKNKSNSLLNYPQNAMKNKIKKLSQSSYTIFLEPGQYFSDFFERKVRYLAEEHLTNNKKNVLIIRNFEILTSSKIRPNNKKVLEQLIKNDTAFEIDQNDFIVTHQTPKLRQWFETNDSFIGSLQFEKSYDNIYWDPIVVLPKIAPPFDEEFPYPFDTDTQHKRELCRANFRFLVVNDVFVYQYANTKLENKLHSNSNESLLLRQKMFIAQKKFNNRMNKLYPETKNTCFT
ncbi:N-acetyllactosaminide beta-1,3-N-acetylglucosaminyltransferase [Strongyloides ratti]|uniref:N-acetyllactosaminide beta-1,3-N-acetylglucosaminyltransferase n=1 Tax=Strongyloides ratti TaxID=34506 RepID=A0A090LE86_STRRB|nr:N-acetyllactosaminide beta-1,3-N-acetylglucosaminyltransferase [Strongyloides ratti]CEF66458.1 N-acetyllactosaminide beta-1,3-N-acetylglucosaminyltransferase [Strongyloides ratti]